MRRTTALLCDSASLCRRSRLVCTARLSPPVQERTLWIGRTAARLLMSAEGGVADVCHVAAATVPKLALAEQAMLWIVQHETSEAPHRTAPHLRQPGAT